MYKNWYVKLTNASDHAPNCQKCTLFVPGWPSLIARNRINYTYIARIPAIARNLASLNSVEEGMDNCINADACTWQVHVHMYTCTHPHACTHAPPPPTHTHTHCMTRLHLVNLNKLFQRLCNDMPFHGAMLQGINWEAVTRKMIHEYKYTMLLCSVTTVELVR